MTIIDLTQHSFMADSGTRIYPELESDRCHFGTIDGSLVPYVTRPPLHVSHDTSTIVCVT